jgi:two-component system sensor histidine kinase LytS
MIVDILTTLFNKMGLIIILAIVLSKLTIFKRLVTNQDLTPTHQLIMAVVFGLFGILGTYFGVEVKGAIANSRAIGVIAGGLLGGPFVGIGAGLIAGIHRWAIDIGGFTAAACALSTITEGFIGGYSYHFIKNMKNKWFMALLIGITSELLQMLIILIVAKPFAAALDLVKVIILPMTIVNSLGIALFIAVTENIFTEASRAKAAQAQLVLKIANKTLPYFRKGLYSPYVREAAKIIHEMTDIAAVAITDTKYILAHVGMGEDHHIAGHEILTALTRNVIEEGKYRVVHTKEEIGCINEDCLLGSAVIVPLKEKDKVIGTLKLYKMGQYSITSVEEELALGMAELFSTQLELSKVERHAQLLANAELKVLQAQINPHFLFNALNTIKSFCRTDPETARDLLEYLGDYYRNNLQGKDFITLAEEFNHIKAYLAIEEARFSDQIQVEYMIDEEILKFQLPSLILQPIVENSIKHGILPKGQGKIMIKGEKIGQEMKITISDNGIGFNKEKLENILSEGFQGKSIGLRNINNRLINIYGQQYRLKISSTKGKGTTVEITIPLRGGKDEHPGVSGR